jgi:hypothetical protein
MIAAPAVGCKRVLASDVVGYHYGMDFQSIAGFRPVAVGYIGFVEEWPGANTQGATLDEARANLQEAVAMILEANRELA